MFTIYSIGDADFLAKILNALALIVGSGQFERLVATGLLLGLLLVCVQCVVSGTRQFNLHHVLIGLICYFCFFGPTTTVHIEDAYTGKVHSVDHVPLGPAFSGSMISNIGYGVTRMFEQGYGPEDRITEHEYAESLKVLNELKDISKDQSILASLNHVIGGNADIERSVMNYISECTFPSLVTGAVSKDELYQRSFRSWNFDSKIYGTKLFLPNLPNDGQLSCADAKKHLNDALAKLRNPEVLAAFQRLSHSAGSTSLPQSQGYLNTLSSSLQALHLGNEMSFSLLESSVIAPLYEKAASGFYRQMGDVAANIMINQAMNQRNVQWASEQTMFMKTVRPLISFFEGLIYAVTPIVAFLLVMGTFGIQLIGRYFQVIVWIQLWLPVLSITNLYINMAASRELMSTLASSTANYEVSFYALNTAGATLETWLGVGGMLAAATPLIALFLVTGSTYAFTTLTGRLGGSDHINEKVASPDVVQPSPYLSTQSAFTGTNFGTVATGFDATMTRFAVGQQVTSALNQARARHKEISDQISEGVAKQQTSSKSSASQVGTVDGVANNRIVNKSQDSRASYGRATESNLGSNSTIGQTTVNEAGTNFTTAASLGAGNSTPTKLEELSSNSLSGDTLSETMVDQASQTLSSGVPGVVSPRETEQGTAEDRQHKGAEKQRKAGSNGSWFMNANGSTTANIGQKELRTSGSNNQTTYSDGQSVRHEWNQSSSDVSSISDQSAASRSQNASVAVNDSETSNLSRLQQELAKSSKLIQNLESLQKAVGSNRSIGANQAASEVLRSDKAMTQLGQHHDFFREHAAEIRNREDVLRRSGIENSQAGVQARLEVMDKHGYGLDVAKILGTAEGFEPIDGMQKPTDTLKAPEALNGAKMKKQQLDEIRKGAPVNPGQAYQSLGQKVGNRINGVALTQNKEASQGNAQTQAMARSGQGAIKSREVGKAEAEIAVAAQKGWSAEHIVRGAANATEWLFGSAGEWQAKMRTLGLTQAQSMVVGKLMGTVFSDDGQLVSSLEKEIVSLKGLDTRDQKQMESAHILAEDMFKTLKNATYEGEGSLAPVIHWNNAMGIRMSGKKDTH